MRKQPWMSCTTLRTIPVLPAPGRRKQRKPMPILRLWYDSANPGVAYLASNRVIKTPEEIVDVASLPGTTDYREGTDGL